jgi:hypothetical protein
MHVKGGVPYLIGSSEIRMACSCSHSEVDAALSSIKTGKNFLQEQNWKFWRVVDVHVNGGGLKFWVINVEAARRCGEARIALSSSPTERVTRGLMWGEQVYRVVVKSGEQVWGSLSI